MDALDRKILAELQRDARLTLTDLADRVRLSLSSCHRRVRELERSGVINSYRARLDPESLGLAFQSIVFITMSEGSQHALAAFEEAIIAIPNVIEAQRLFGDPDYLLRVVAADVTAFRELYDAHLSALPYVRKLSSTLIMKTVVDERPLPLEG